MIKKLKNFLNKDFIKKIAVVLFYLVWVGSIALKSFYVQFTINVNKAPIMTKINGDMTINLLFSVVAIFGVALFLSGKKSRLVLIILDAFLTFVFFADMLYGRYYYNPITVPILKQIGFLDDVTSSAASLFRLKDMILLADFVVLIVLAFYLRKYRTKRPFYIQMIVGCVVIAIGLFGFQYRLSQQDTSKFVYERKYIGRDLGLLYYHYYDVSAAFSQAVSSKKVLTDAELSLVESMNTADVHTNAYSNIGEGKNLIVIQLEAFQNFLIDLEVDGKEVTPFLNDLKDTSIYASNYFIETAGGNTVDAELLTNTSLHPTYAGSAYYEYPSNTYISLPKKLKDLGYAVNSFHGYEASFWNREVMHKTLGFERFFSLNDFDDTEKVGWAVSDRSFFEQSIKFSVEQSQGKPFFSMMVTLSSHYPYDAFYSGTFTKAEGDSQNIVRRYLNAGHYVDAALRKFFDYLKTSGLYENTIVVIYGDHAGLFNDEPKAAFELLGKEYSPFNWTKLETVPLFIHIPGQEEGVVVDKVCGQKDIFPTLGNIMGFELEYTMGQDILDSSYAGHMVRRSSNIVTNEFVYIAGEEQVYDFKTGEKLDTSLYKVEIERYYDQLLAADLIYKSDYFSTLIEE